MAARRRSSNRPLLLTAAGIYGVLAFAIARRSKELAVRIAIGASPHHIARLVSSYSVRLVGTGTAVGLGATWTLGRLVKASAGAGTPFDPGRPAFIAPLVVVVAVGVAASWLPLVRALRIGPAATLRTD